MKKIIKNILPIIKFMLVLTLIIYIYILFTNKNYILPTKQHLFINNTQIENFQIYNEYLHFIDKLKIKNIFHLLILMMVK